MSEFSDNSASSGEEFEHNKELIPEIEITSEMIEAGVNALNSSLFGQPYEIIVREVFWSMYSAKSASRHFQ